jgi:metal-dependent amidase/aminoacylase/carboxypeptidase family protein
MGTTGILIYKGKEEGKTVLFRCELDALPIEN